MKKMNLNVWMLWVVMLITPAFVACNDDDDDEPEVPKGNTIADIASGNPDFSILVAALDKAGLVGAVADNNASLTVFAPTNAAFAALLDELDVSSLDDIPAETLKPILLYHVLGTKATASQVKTGYYNSISPGPTDGSFLSLFVDMSTGKINDRSMITDTDIMASNGVIHVIDKVMLPLTIAGHAVANSTFSSLVAALTKAELVGAVADPEALLTVFAPTNDAFAEFLEGLGVSFEDLTKEALTPILLYHVVDAFVPSSGVPNAYVPTLSAAFEKYMVVKTEKTDVGVFLNKNAKVVLADVVATNGIVHAIDMVITPPTVVDIAIQNPNFSILVEAVVKSGLAETLSTAGPFTVFAPTNDAFSALFGALGVSGIADLSAEALTPILLAHVVAGNVQSGDLSSGTVPTLNGSKQLDVVVSSEGVTIDGSIKVQLANVQGKNGVIHVIDKVIIP